MAHLIDKDALVAKIEKLKKSHNNWSCMGKRFHQDYETILSFLDSIEVKEVDLDKEIDDYMAKEWEGIEEDKHLYDMIKNNLFDIAKHFFELGLKESHHLTWKDINLIDHLLFDIKEDYDNCKLDKEEYYKEVLKKFKEQL